MTGAMLPEGCDCVVPVEQVSVAGGVAVLEEGTQATALRFVHPRGSDYCAGDVLLQPGTLLRAPNVQKLKQHCGVRRQSARRC